MKDFPTCASCRFWFEETGSEGQAECRRYAMRPRAYSWKGEEGGEKFTPNWPVTFEWEGCGEHQEPADAG